MTVKTIRPKVDLLRNNPKLPILLHTHTNKYMIAATARNSRIIDITNSISDIIKTTPLCEIFILYHIYVVLTTFM